MSESHDNRTIGGDFLDKPWHLGGRPTGWKLRGQNERNVIARQMREGVKHMETTEPTPGGDAEKLEETRPDDERGTALDESSEEAKPSEETPAEEPNQGGGEAPADPPAESSTSPGEGQV